MLCDRDGPIVVDAKHLYVVHLVAQFTMLHLLGGIRSKWIRVAICVAFYIDIARTADIRMALLKRMCVPWYHSVSVCD